MEASGRPHTPAKESPVPTG